jgi:hypothetical protein
LLKLWKANHIVKDCRELQQVTQNSKSRHFSNSYAPAFDRNTSLCMDSGIKRHIILGFDNFNNVIINTSNQEVCTVGGERNNVQDSGSLTIKKNLGEIK